ncbi:hypothetical protein [Cryptosporangium sp. NPDC048952]|uniref:hypothetical protein n=1 Tax=Cryptosporangium sp. NPDC048952 TaxID=3363961 RepID=UPI003714766E
MRRHLYQLPEQPRTGDVMMHGRFHPDEITAAARLRVIPVDLPDLVPPRGVPTRGVAAPHPADRRPVVADDHDDRSNLFDRLEARLAAGLRRRRGQPDTWYTRAA